MLHAIIPAGGAGSRLWPLSRKGHPKFLHDLTGAGRTLLQATVDRLKPLTESIVVVTGQSHTAAVAEQLPQLPQENVLAEPSPRDSMAAIGLAAAILLRRHPDQDVIVGSFAADHVITDQAAFADAVTAAVEVARGGYVVTIGIQPTGPSTAFGYIETGAPIATGGTITPLHVAAFTEKPDADLAAEYLATGRYRWNAGMFVARASVLLDHLRDQQPELATGLAAIADAWDTDERGAVLDERWPELTKIPIDHAIAEPVAAAGGVAVVPATFGWDDVGDWASLRGLLETAAGTERTAGGSTVLGELGHALAVDASDSLIVPRAGRKVVVLGIPDAVVVDTPDALLVTTVEHAQRVKDIVTELSAESGDLT